MVKIVDNYLDEYKFDKLRKMIVNQQFHWTWTDYVAREDEEKSLFYLTHVLCANQTLTRQKSWPHIHVSQFYNSFLDIFTNMVFDAKTIIRIKVNCYPRGDVLEEHGMHQDYEWEHKGALLSLNTCDGYTRFETGEKIDSVANRMIFFDPSVRHTSTNTTNDKRRININLNYF